MSNKDEIIAIAKEMATQDNLATQFPYWVVRESTERIANEYDDPENFRERGEEWYNDFHEDYCCVDDCQKMLDKHEDEGTIPDFEDLCYDCQKQNGVGVMVEEVDATRPAIFFTLKACKEHIASNGYHYQNPRPYCRSAWRSYEIQAVMKRIFITAGMEIPNHYK